MMIIIINSNWVVTRWQWLFYMYTKYEIGSCLDLNMQEDEEPNVRNKSYNSALCLCLCAPVKVGRMDVSVVIFELDEGSETLPLKPLVTPDTENMKSC